MKSASSTEFGNRVYIDATRGRTTSRTFIVCHVVPEGRKEKRCQSTFAETPCYTLTLSEVVLPLVASMYVLGHEGVIRRLPPLRFLFGMKAREKRTLQVPHS